MGMRITTRVKNGVKWLDKHGPENWRKIVTIEELDMSSPCRCVLGQVFDKTAETAGSDNAEKYDHEYYNPFYDGMDGYEYVLNKYDGRVICDHPDRYGFDAVRSYEVDGKLVYASNAEVEADFEALAKEWERVLSGAA